MKFSQGFVVALATLLAACGGGGGGSTSGGGGGGTTSLVLSGTAAKGAALAGVTVDVKCATGSGSTTTSSSGAFTLTISGGSLPCVLEAPVGDGTLLHSAISGSGAGTFTVNVSPLTELVVAQALGILPATLFTEFATRLAAVTATSLTDAVAAIVAKLVTSGIDLAGTNPLSDPLVVGNAQDQKIDALVAQLAAAGSTLVKLTETVAAGSPNTPPPPVPDGSETVSLPANLLANAAAANCSALRSGAYRVIRLEAATQGNASTEVFTLNADTLVLTHSDGSTGTLVPIGSCRYTNADGGDITVSQGGVIVNRTKNAAGDYRIVLAFPEQAHTLADLQGSWNNLSWERNATTGLFAAQSDTGTFDATGKLTAVKVCADVKTCTDLTGTALPAVQLAVNAQGGFDLNNTTPGNVYTDRMFVYTPGGGATMVVTVSAGGSFNIGTRQRVNPLPPVGRVLRFWNPTIDIQGLAPSPITEDGDTILSNDEVAQTWTRRRLINNGLTVTETRLGNNPRNGYSYRAAGTATASDGSTAFTIRESIALNLRGTGVSMVWLPSLNSYIISVVQPDTAASLPSALLSKPNAANCAALRSGTIRFVEAYPASPGLFQTGTRIVDAATLRILSADGLAVDTQLVANGGCRYTSDAGAGDVVVSAAGVINFRSPESDLSTRSGLAFPEQSHSIAELAGTWNKIGISQTATLGTYAADAATATVDAAGAVTAISYCVDVTNCLAVTGKTITHAVNPAGGFDRTSSVGDLWTDRVFAYAAGSGDLMLVNLGSDGSIGLWTPARANTLPTVGTRNRNFNIDINAQLKSPGALSLADNTVASVDAATGNYVRTRKTSMGATYSETLQANKPRDGYTFRPAATPTASDGSVVTVREFTALGMKGMGFSALTLPSNSLTNNSAFEFSVGQP